MTSDASAPAAPTTPQHGVKTDMMIEGEGRPAPAPAGFRFGRIFPGLSAVTLRLSACRAIGERMTAMPELSRKDSAIPAGYTYFGQFVDHDITFDETKSESEGDVPQTPEIEATPDNDLILRRSPSLDLDSVYGGSNRPVDIPMDGASFVIGETTPTPGVGVGHVDRALRYDLPRGEEGKEPGVARVAAIGDPRNDENLAVAQTHLMWMKFHNEIVARLRSRRPKAREADLFAEARELTTRHYQHVVLHDFVRRFIDKDAYADIIVGGKRKTLRHCSGEVAFMPLEFSVAAYRFGHSQVRETYDWNVNFGTGNGVLPSTQFRLLFTFSEVSGNLGGNPTLPTNWIADFRRLYDFGKTDFPHLADGTAGSLNFAKNIDPYLASDLGRLPEIERMRNDQTIPEAQRPPFSNLAALNLRRGSMRALPSGQDVVAAIPGVKALTVTEMKSVLDPDFKEAMKMAGFFERTPLWLYILLEAAARGDGETMGPLGSILIADTFRTLVLTSRISILTPDAPWTPAEAQALLGADKPLETIPDILLWMDAREPIVDPLQDRRLNRTMM